MPRHELTVEVTFESKHNFYTGISEDLSTGGLFVVTDMLCPVGECIRVRFTLPGSTEVMDAITEVRWVRSTDMNGGETGMGLQFLQMSAKTKQAVKAFADKRVSMVCGG
jgi:uncharacterized protein (TIGR02266 family)